MSLLLARIRDGFWHHVYWTAVRIAGTRPEWVTDLAERRADARLALLKALR